MRYHFKVLLNFIERDQKMNRFRGVILEGHSNAGKTSVLKALKKLQANDDRSERSIIILSEHYSQVLHRVNGELQSLNRDEHIKLLMERVSMLRKLSDWAKEIGGTHRAKGIYFILERFHLNHRSAFPDSVLDDIIQLEIELFEMGAQCALLTISPKQAEKRIMSRNPQYWRKKTENEVKVAAEQLLLSQQNLRHHANASEIPTFEINTDEEEWEKYARQIYHMR